MTDAKPRVLIVVGSSGAEPYTSIEMRGQLPTFGRERVPGVECVWVEGEPALSNRWSFIFLERILEKIHLNLYAPTIQIEIGRRVYAFEDGALTRNYAPQAMVESRRRVSLRINWGRLVARTYRPLRAQNGFSRVVALILNKLADGKHLRSGNRITLSFPNSYFLSPWRSFLRYQVVLELFEFDFVLFTTSTCYVDLVRLEHFCRSLPRTRLYAGQLMRLGAPFVAGNSILMSRDVVEAVVHHKPHYRLDLPDDVALGFLVRDFDLAEIQDIPTENLPFGPGMPGNLSQLSSNPYLFRCKAEPKTQNPEQVIENMVRLHAHVLEHRRRHD